MTVREWFRELRRSQPPSVELREFCESLVRDDVDRHAREALFLQVLIAAGLMDDPPGALTWHRLLAGSSIMTGALQHGRDGEPRLVLPPRPRLVPDADYPLVGVWVTDPDEPTLRDFASAADYGVRDAYVAYLHFRPGVSGDPTPDS